MPRDREDGWFVIPPDALVKARNMYDGDADIQTEANRVKSLLFGGTMYVTAVKEDGTFDIKRSYCPKPIATSVRFEWPSVFSEVVDDLYCFGISLLGFQVSTRGMDRGRELLDLLFTPVRLDITQLQVSVKVDKFGQMIFRYTSGDGDKSVRLTAAQTVVWSKPSAVSSCNTHLAQIVRQQARIAEYEKLLDTAVTFRTCPPIVTQQAAEAMRPATKQGLVDIAASDTMEAQAALGSVYEGADPSVFEFLSSAYGSADVGNEDIETLLTNTRLSTRMEMYHAGQVADAFTRKFAHASRQGGPAEAATTNMIRIPDGMVMGRQISADSILHEVGWARQVKKQLVREMFGVGGSGDEHNRYGDRQRGLANKASQGLDKNEGLVRMENLLSDTATNLLHSVMADVYPRVRKLFSKDSTAWNEEDDAMFGLDDDELYDFKRSHRVILQPRVTLDTLMVMRDFMADLPSDTVARFLTDILRLPSNVLEGVQTPNSTPSYKKRKEPSDDTAEKDAEGDAEAGTKDRADGGAAAKRKGGEGEKDGEEDLGRKNSSGRAEGEGEGAANKKQRTAVRGSRVRTNTKK